MKILSLEEIQKVRELYATHSMPQLAKMFYVSLYTIFKCCEGLPRKQAGKNPEKLNELRELYKTHTAEELALKYECTSRTIYRLCEGTKKGYKGWTRVPRRKAI